MKILSALVLTSALFVSNSVSAKGPAAAKAAPHAKESAPQAALSIKVKGMTCENCEKKVTEALKKIDGVADARADHVKGEALVILKNNAKPDIMAMKKAVRDLGYEVQ